MGDKSSEERLGGENTEARGDPRDRLEAVVERAVAEWQEPWDGDGSGAPFPSRMQVVAVLEDLMDLLLTGGIRGPDGLARQAFEARTRRTLHGVFEDLSSLIATSLRHECLESGEPCRDCSERGEQMALLLLERLPALRSALLGDAKAAFNRDPAARSLGEVLVSYPGLRAIATYRLAHELWLLGVEFIPRMMTEYAHAMTGIDIHPGATVGSNFFIDHGTGVVIGETSEIGDNVTLYQGVTLGGYRFRRAPDGTLERGYKRHPTVGDNVIIYAGATILGGDTVIGAGTVIGGSVWLTHSVPPGAVITIQEPDLKYRVGY